MRNLLMTLVLCGVAQLASASAECPAPAPAVVPPATRPTAELISSAAAQAPLGSPAAQPGAMMVPASVHGTTTVLGGPPSGTIAESESPRRGSRLAMVLAALGVMIVIVLRRVSAAG